MTEYPPDRSSPHDWMIAGLIHARWHRFPLTLRTYATRPGRARGSSLPATAAVGGKSLVAAVIVVVAIGRDIGLRMREEVGVIVDRVRLFSAKGFRMLAGALSGGC